MNDGVVSRARSRQTGTVVEVIDNRDGFFDSCDPNGWFTLCVDHGGVCSHETRALAISFAPVPREWCPTCQEEERMKPFTIVRRTRGGTPYFQVTDHRTHKDYRAATKREATAIAKQIERGEDPDGRKR